MQIEVIDLREILHKLLTHAIESKLVDERVIRHKTYNPISSLQTICRPTEEANIRVIELSLECRFRAFHICIFNVPINYWVLTVLIIIILVLLPNVIWWIANHHHNLSIFLTLHPFSVRLYKQR